MKNKIVKILTQNLEIRFWHIEDAQMLKDRLDDNLEQLIPYISWAINEPESLEHKKDRIKNWIDNFHDNIEYGYLILERTTGKFVGTCNMFGRRGKGTIEIGYWIDKLQTSKGYATETSYALTKLAFEHIKVEKVLAYIDVNNKASQRIPEKINFTHEYTYRELLKNKMGKRMKFQVWVMFIEEFRNKKEYGPIEFRECIECS